MYQESERWEVIIQFQKFLILRQGLVFKNWQEKKLQAKSSSPCRAISTDIPEPLSPPHPIVYRFRQVLWATTRILTDLLYVCSSRSPCFCSTTFLSVNVYINYLWIRRECPFYMLRLFWTNTPIHASLWEVWPINTVVSCLNFWDEELLIFIIKGFRTIVFIFIAVTCSDSISYNHVSSRTPGVTVISVGSLSF